MVEVTTKSSERTGSRRTSVCVQDLFAIKIEQSESRKPSLPTKDNGIPIKEQGSDFEEAMTATGYGKFHILVLLCSFPGFSTAVYVSSALSFIMTSAECDLKMNMADMGKLNIFTYAGMLSSALLWGFLSDTLGRKKIMVWGYLALSLCELIAAQSQTYLVLSVAKYFAGFVFNGPFAVMISYISEMHAASIRAKVIVYMGAFYSFGNMNLPLIAWGVIPQDWTISFFDGGYVLHSWQIFLALFSIPPMITGFACMLLPESPKFLMSRGRNDEALNVFRKMFAMNKGLPEDQYPIKSLVNEMSASGDGNEQAPEGWAAIKGGLKQLRPLVTLPHVAHLFLVCFVMLAAMLGTNTLRLWFPQMATIIEDYDSKHQDTAPLCQVLEAYVANKTQVVEEISAECVVLASGTDTYVNSMIIGGSSFIAYLLGGILVNTIGKRKLTALGLVGSGACAVAMYFSTSLPEVVALFAIFVSITSLSGSVLSSIAVDLFPTSISLPEVVALFYISVSITSLAGSVRSSIAVDLFHTSIRAMAVAIMMMSGRMGTVLGGVTFPYMLEMGCLFPFMAIAAVLTVSGMFTMALPRTTLSKLI